MPDDSRQRGSPEATGGVEALLAMRASGWRHKRFALLDDVGDSDPGLFVAGFAAGMGRFGWIGVFPIGQYIRNMDGFAR